MQNDNNNWILQAQRGDKEAFSELVEAYHKQVYSLTYRMLGNSGDAEDASQETFLRAYNGIKRFDPKKKFITWLLSIAANYCIDQRRKRRLPTFSFEDMPYLQFPAKQPGIEKMYTTGEENQEIHQMLEILKPKDRAAVIFYYWHDYSYEEIAAALSMTTSAVKSRLHRAKREMAAAWMQAKKQPVLQKRTQYEAPTI